MKNAGLEYEEAKLQLWKMWGGKGGTKTPVLPLF